jgi:hypothetical protein
MDKINGLKVCLFCENLRVQREKIKIPRRPRRFSQNLFIKLFCPLTSLLSGTAFALLENPKKFRRNRIFITKNLPIFIEFRRNGIKNTSFLRNSKKL